MWLAGYYDLNLIWAILVFFMIFMVVFNGLIDLCEKSLPLFVVEAFRYGKSLNGPVQSSIVRSVSVPKSWFLHFYIFSSIYTPCLLYLAVQRYVLARPPPAFVVPTLDFFCTESRHASTTPEAVLLALGLLCLQCIRRLYECAFVNAKSTSTMNILHYIVGYAHYFSTGTGILCEAPAFNRDTGGWELGPLVSLKHAVLTAVFLLAWYNQLYTHKIFAAMRRSGRSRHGVPQGGLFSLVSCPHYLSEIIIYTVLMLVVGLSDVTLVLVWCWVVTNQVVAALMSHHWYRDTFKDYPRHRKAIIPFLL